MHADIIFTGSRGQSYLSHKLAKESGLGLLSQTENAMLTDDGPVIQAWFTKTSLLAENKAIGYLA